MREKWGGWKEHWVTGSRGSGFVVLLISRSDLETTRCIVGSTCDICLHRSRSAFPERSVRPGVQANGVRALSTAREVPSLPR